MILMIVDITSKIDDSKKTGTYTNDVTAVRRDNQLNNWRKFEYYPEASKTCLYVKEKSKQQTLSIFKDTAIKITTEGQRHLGAVPPNTNMSMFRTRLIYS